VIIFWISIYDIAYILHTFSMTGTRKGASDIVKYSTGGKNQKKKPLKNIEVESFVRTYRFA